MTSTLYLHPGDLKEPRDMGGIEGLTVRKVRRNILLRADPRPVTTYRVEHGHFGVLGFCRDESDIGAFGDRRQAKREARKAAARLGLVPRAVLRKRLA